MLPWRGPRFGLRRKSDLRCAASPPVQSRAPSRGPIDTSAVTRALLAFSVLPAKSAPPPKQARSRPRKDSGCRSGLAGPPIASAERSARTEPSLALVRPLRPPVAVAAAVKSGLMESMRILQSHSCFSYLRSIRKVPAILVRRVAFSRCPSAGTSRRDERPNGQALLPDPLLGYEIKNRVVRLSAIGATRSAISGFSALSCAFAPSH